MEKLIFWLIFPGLLAGFISKDIPKTKICKSKIIAEGLFFSYLLFMADVTLVFACYNNEYADFLKFMERSIQTIQDVFSFVLLLLVQLIGAVALGLFSRMIRYRSVEKAFLQLSNVQKKTGTVVCFSVLMMSLLFLVAKDNAERQLVINEVCSRNDKVAVDENGNYTDYIEIYNSSKWNILLKDFKISDEAELNNAIILEEAVLPAKGYYIIWIDEENGSKFNLSDRGERIYLAEEGGEILDSVEVPQLDANLSYARTQDGAELWKAEVPTPLMANNEKLKYLEEPVFSADSGFYKEEFLLTITANEGEKIYYTLDGSDPDENAFLYEEAILVENVCDKPSRYRSITNVTEEWENDWYEIPLDKLFIIRAISIDEEGNTSDIVTKNYLVDMEEYKNQYVLSLVSDPEDLFGDNGIYVTGKDYDEWYLGMVEGAMPTPNFMRGGKEAEIETAVTLLKENVLMEQQAGLRIQGASARAYALKRFSVYSRKEYSGERYFEYDLFDNRSHAFFMREDFEDALIHKLVENRDIGGLDAIPAAVFLNGEFWYHTYLREKYNEDYLAEVYQVDKEQVRIEEAIPTEIYSFLDTHDLSKKEDYEAFCEIVDIQSYIDYLSTNIYMCNMDASEGKNCRMWRTTVKTGNKYGDMKWRFLIYDTDSLAWNSMSYYETIRFNIDSFSQKRAYIGNAYNEDRVFVALKKNEAFCKQFVLTFMDLANTNFSPEVIEKELVNWGIDMSWNDGFFENRFGSIVPALAKEFALQGTLEEICLTINEANAGIVKVNSTIPTFTNNCWNGKYYTDYPITVTASPLDGFEFVGWKYGEKILKEPELTIRLEKGGCTLEALFERKEGK